MEQVTTYQIKTKNEEQQKAVLTCLFALGYDYLGCKSVREVQEKIGFHFSYIVLYPVSKEIGGNYNARQDFITVTLDEYLAAFENDEYTKVPCGGRGIGVSKDTVVIGNLKVSKEEFCNSWVTIAGESLRSTDAIKIYETMNKL